MAETIGARWVVRKVFKQYRSPFWYGAVRDKRTGKMHYTSTQTTNKKHAKQRVLDFVRELEARETHQEFPRMRFDRAFEEWLSLKTLRPLTEVEYRTSYTGVYLPAFGDSFLSDIRPKDVDRFLKDLETKRKSSPRTREKHLTRLRSFFRWSARNDYCAGDPTDGIRVPRGAKRKGTALSVEEARRLLQKCREPTVLTMRSSRRESWQQTYTPPPHLFLAVLISLHTGLRRGNVLDLKWKEVDLGRRKIVIPAERMKAYEDHEVPIHPELFAALQDRLRRLSKIAPDSSVLGQELSSMKRSFKRAVKLAELPDMRWHDLRHTFATWASTRCSYAALRQLLGHSPGTVTLQYTHVPFEELQRAVDSLPRLITEPERGAERAEASQ